MQGVCLGFQARDLAIEFSEGRLILDPLSKATIARYLSINVACVSEIIIELTVDVLEVKTALDALVRSEEILAANR